MEGISKTLGWVETDQVCVLTKYTRGYVNDERKITAHFREERLTIKNQPPKMNGGGEKEMAQERYSKAEVLSDPCWLFK